MAQGQPRAVQGALTIRRDDAAGAIRLTAGPWDDTAHEWLGSGVALILDRETHVCVGVLLVIGLDRPHPHRAAPSGDTRARGCRA